MLLLLSSEDTIRVRATRQPKIGKIFSSIETLSMVKRGKEGNKEKAETASQTQEQIHFAQQVNESKIEFIDSRKNWKVEIRLPRIMKKSCRGPFLG